MGRGAFLGAVGCPAGPYDAWGARNPTQHLPASRSGGAAAKICDMEVVGADVWKRRWVAVVLENGRFARAGVFATFHDLMSGCANADVIGVDIPIGLPTGAARRPADVAARKFLGAKRQNSVFWTVPAEVLRAPTHPAAILLCEQLTGSGISAQSYALREHILEVAALVRAGDRVREVHPEVSFRAMAGRPLGWAKKTWNGLSERRELLRREGIDIPSDLGAAGEAAPDDVLDAAAAAWTAHRVATHSQQSLPLRPDVYEGRPVAIWY